MSKTGIAAILVPILVVMSVKIIPLKMLADFFKVFGITGSIEAGLTVLYLVIGFELLMLVLFIVGKLRKKK